MRFEDRTHKFAPDLGSKLVDWNALAAAGGEDLIYRKRVLDLGPCFGLDAFLFARKATHPFDEGAIGRYVAIDDDAEIELWMRERVPEAEFALGALPGVLGAFADESFDTVLDFSTLDNVLYGDSAYREIARLLAPGGTLVTTFANALLIKSSDGEHPLHPSNLQSCLEGFGLTRRYAADWHRERAALVMVKP